MNVNLRGTFMTIKYGVPLLKKHGGAIVVVSSVIGTRMFSASGTYAYGAAKAAEVALTKMLALELAEYKIRINCICPGTVETEIQSAGQYEKRNLEHIRKPVLFPEGTIPLGRTGEPEEIAHVIHFLLSDKAEWITGTELFIDGGQSLLVA